GHVALENDLADFFGCRGTIVFSKPEPPAEAPGTEPAWLPTTVEIRGSKAERPTPSAIPA
ncbi:unnamed protein product, partial [marine sediment metagenome]